MTLVSKSASLDADWRFNSTTSTRSSAGDWQPSRRLPTEIHLDLLANHAIPDPFHAKNEEAVQWVGEQTWVYEREFDIPKDAFKLDSSKAALVFEGLDTFATVKLNSREVLRSDNMFVSHRVELSSAHLVEGRQQLQIIFENAERAGDDEVSKYPQHDWFSFSNGTARLATRKAQYHYGWDWGPKLMTCGPWKPIYLELYNSRISDFAVHTKLASDLQYADVEVGVEVEGSATQAYITLRRDGAVQHEQSVSVQQNVAKAVFHLHAPDLWWPHTLGKANLYEANVVLYEQAGPSDLRSVAEQTKRFGIRKVELVQQSFPDQEGASFFFKLNNVRVFAAGSCWIPADSFTSRISSQRYRDWIQLARNSNQNMIRVWGGGIYEHDAFYDACDEQGILVWQDFMFACGNFPAYPDIRKSVAIEAKQNVRRMRHHPSVVLWCGNNEDYIIPLLRQIPYDASQHDPDKILESNFPARYFYEHMLPTVCHDLSPDVPYWPGSPFGGSMANSQDVGDIHQWHVWHLEMAPYQDFARLAGRFVSEFGMQALPCLDTARDFFPRGHHLAESADVTDDDYVKWHNKMEDGRERMAHYGDANINVDNKSLAGYIYSTQLIQSEAVSAAYRSWRRLWQGSGKEYCGGALVWQLNDCWPVASWAIADYYLRPKMAYWAVRRECAPITAGLDRVKVDARTVALDVWAVNMTQVDINFDVVLQAWDVVTGASIYQCVLYENALLQTNQSTAFDRLDLDALVPAAFSAEQKESGFKDIVFALRLVGPATAGTEAASQAISFHEPLREISFGASPADLKFSIVRNGSGDVVVEVFANRPSKGLLVQVKDDPDATWDDNGMDLIPGQVVRLKYMGKSLGLGQEHRLQARWLGGEWNGWDRITASL